MLTLPSVKPPWESALTVTPRGACPRTPNPVKLKGVLASGSTDRGHPERAGKRSQILKSPKSELFLIPEIFENRSSPLLTGQHSETEGGELP